MKNELRRRRRKQKLWPSSVSATPPVIEIYFLFGNDSTPENYHHFFKSAPPLVGGVDYHPHPLFAFGHHPHTLFLRSTLLNPSPHVCNISGCCFSTLPRFCFAPRLTSARSGLPIFLITDGWEHGLRYAITMDSPQGVSSTGHGRFRHSSSSHYGGGIPSTK